jgi:hypothetical protein
VNIAAEGGTTALYVASSRRDAEAVRMLLAAVADVNLKRDDGTTNANATQSSPDQTENFPSAQVIGQLRHRLISPDFAIPSR